MSTFAEGRNTTNSSKTQHNPIQPQLNVSCKQKKKILKLNYQQHPD